MQLQELDGEDEDQQTETGTNCQTVHSSINNTLSVTLNGASGGVGTRSPSTNSSSFRNVSFRVWKKKEWSPKNVNPVLEFWKLLISLPTHKLDSLTNLLVYNEC